MIISLVENGFFMSKIKALSKRGDLTVFDKPLNRAFLFGGVMLARDGVKQCYWCKNIKPVSCFSRDKKKKDGLFYICKECHNKDRVEYNRTHREARISYGRKHWQDNRERLAEQSREYYAKNKEAILERTKRKRLSDPEFAKKYRARQRLSKHIHRGKVIRKPCAICGKKRKTEAHHHNGYDNPFDVQWLCGRCHRKVHRKHKEIA